MAKLIRCLNKQHNWLDYTNSNNLNIENLTCKRTISSYEKNHSEGILTNYYEVNFNILKEEAIISTIQQKLSAELFDDLDTSNADILSKIYQLLASLQELRFSQKIFMTYLNEEECLLFNQEVGDPILLTQKNFYANHQLILVEEELSRLESYLFKEDDF